MGNRRLVEFAITREDLPPRQGFNAELDVPHGQAMAAESLRVTDKYHPGWFHDVLGLALPMYELANPGREIVMTDETFNASGDMDACTLTVAEAEAA